MRHTKLQDNQDGTWNIKRTYDELEHKDKEFEYHNVPKARLIEFLKAESQSMRGD